MRASQVRVPARPHVQSYQAIFILHIVCFESAAAASVSMNDLNKLFTTVGASKIHGFSARKSFFAKIYRDCGENLAAILAFMYI